MCRADYVDVHLWVDADYVDVHLCVDAAEPRSKQQILWSKSERQQ